MLMKVRYFHESVQDSTLRSANGMLGLLSSMDDLNAIQKFGVKILIFGGYAGIFPRSSHPYKMLG